MNAPNPNRMGHIDSIRGIAALSVLYLHTAAAFIGIPAVRTQGTFLHDFASYLSFGKTGVIAFFAISGFVICPTLKGQRYEGARKFIISRLFRLYPAFWAAIFLTVLINFAWKGSAIDWSQVLGNIPMLYSVFHVQPLQGLFWTLEVELVFYAICLLLFLSGWLHRPELLFMAGFILTAIFQFVLDRPELQTNINRTLAFHWIEMPYFLAIMFWGGLFRIWYDDRQSVCSLGGYRIPVIVFVISLLFIIMLRPLIWVDQYMSSGHLESLTAAIPFFLGMGLFIVGSLFVKITNPVFVWLGTISYSVYLLHPVVFLGVLHMVSSTFPEWGDMHVSVYLTVCTALTILLSSLVYHCVERPAISFGRQLQNSKKPTKD